MEHYLNLMSYVRRPYKGFFTCMYCLFLLTCIFFYIYGYSYSLDTVIKITFDLDLNSQLSSSVLIVYELQACHGDILNP